MAGGSNRFLYSKYSRIIFLKKHSFNKSFSVPLLPMYLLREVLLPPQTFSIQMYREGGKVFLIVHVYLYLFCERKCIGVS